MSTDPVFLCPKWLHAKIDYFQEAQYTTHKNQEVQHCLAKQTPLLMFAIVATSAFANPLFRARVSYILRRVDACEYILPSGPLQNKNPDALSAK
ncbi:hypothetical protein GJV06_14020 [Enterobacteriaceae bacterium RIT691]|nr:hypothetical protein [Enterobacteriaceae bacterium RIT691]